MQTGFFVRIERHGKWNNYDIADLSDQELEEFFGDKTPQRLAAWAKTLAIFIRDLQTPNQNEDI